MAGSRKRQEILSEFWCISCGKKGIPVMRNRGRQRPEGHRKKLYCVHCRVVINHISPDGCLMLCPYKDEKFCEQDLIQDALALLKEQEARIQKYEYVFDFLGIGFRQWATKILDGEAEAICETDEHEYKTVVTFKLI